MATYSFKSAGRTTETITNTELAKTALAIGIRTPMRSDNTNFIGMHYSLSDSIQDNLRNLILTNHGERLGLYDFGANLKPLTTELSSQDDFDTAAIQRISQAVSKWMPYVDLENFSSRVNREENTNTAIIELTITYNISSLSSTSKSLVVSMYAI
jgi:phage baseplate assembly protein W